VFFYAGHGLQVAGENYLAPVDARLLTPTALDFELMKVAIIQRAMELSTKTNILFLDACRDNPPGRNLARSFGSRSADVGKGLAQIEAGSGTLISFSTQPGAVALDGKGRNSPYSEALIKHLSASDDDLNAILIAVRNDVMTETQDAQVPWENSALRGRIYFKEAASASGLSKAAPERGARHAAHSAGAPEPTPLRRPLTAEDTLAFDVTVSCEKLSWTSGDLYQKDAKLSVKSGRAEFSRPIHWPTVTDPVIGVEIGNGMVGSNGHLVVDAGWTSPRRRYRARYEGDVTTRGGVLTGGQDWISDGKSYRRNCILELTAR
jgi:hypothetical protein